MNDSVMKEIERPYIRVSGIRFFSIKIKGVFIAFYDARESGRLTFETIQYQYVLQIFWK
jgi:hypothetical protein